MYELSWNRKVFDYKFFAALQGIDLDKEGGEPQVTASSEKRKPVLPLFGDPKDYEGLPKEERKKMTDEMLAQHRRWAGSKPLGGE